MKRFWVFLLCILLSQILYADSYNVATVLPNGQEGLGTAFCVANTTYGSLMVTAKHVIEGSDNVFISHGGKWVKGRYVNRCPSDDVATFEVPVRLKATRVASIFPEHGILVTVEGKGPDYQKTGEDYAFTGKTAKDGYVLSDLSVVQGDSGGPVYAETTSSGRVVVGLVTGYTKRRRDRVETKIVPAQTIVSFIQSQYGGCPNGFCPIQIRPQVQQPMIGIGVPVGPPRTVGVAEPVTPIYVPQEQQEQESYPQNREPAVAGPQGPPGKDGKDGRAPTEQEIRLAVEAWIKVHKSELVGPPGPKGPPPSMQEMIPIIAQAIDTTISQNPERYFPRQGELSTIGTSVSVDDDKPSSNESLINELVARIDALEKRKITIVQGEEKPDGTITQIGESRQYDLNKPIPIVTKRVDVKDGK